MLKLTIATLAATITAETAAPETAASETCGARLPIKALQYSCPVSIGLLFFEPLEGSTVAYISADALYFRPEIRSDKFLFKVGDPILLNDLKGDNWTTKSCSDVSSKSRKRRSGSPPNPLGPQRRLTGGKCFVRGMCSGYNNPRHPPTAWFPKLNFPGIQRRIGHNFYCVVRPGKILKIFYSYWHMPF